MTQPTTQQGTRQAVFLLGFLLVALLVAGVVSYLASSSPDGLDTVTLEGCEVTETAAGEELTGECIAKDAADSPVAGSPFADYGIGGNSSLVGLAGVVGVLVTALIGGGVFWLIRRRGSSDDSS